MANREQQRGVLRAALAQRVPQTSVDSIPPEQLDALIENAFFDETFLLDLKEESLPAPTILPGVRTLLLRYYGAQPGVGELLPLTCVSSSVAAFSQSVGGLQMDLLFFQGKKFRL